MHSPIRRFAALAAMSLATIAIPYAQVAHASQGPALAARGPLTISRIARTAVIGPGPISISRIARTAVIGPGPIGVAGKAI